MEFTMKIILLYTLLGVCLSTLKDMDDLEWKTEAYRYLNYTEMRAKISELEKLYPRLMKVETAA